MRRPELNVHHLWMARVLALVVVLDLSLGAWFGLAGHLGVLNGMYFAVVTVTTVGYGDLVPHGWQQHVAALGIMVLIVPLWTGSFALLATGLTANHVDRRHRELKDHITGSTSG